MLARECLVALAIVNLCLLPALATDIQTVVTFSFASDRIQTCPANTTSATGTSTLLGCLCAPGHRASTETVSLCESCEVDTHADTLGALSCTACPDNSKTLPGAVSAAQCLCAEGYTRLDGACVACDKDTYKTHVGNSACRQCPANTTQPLGSSARSSLASCECVPGHTGLDGGPCAECSAGKFKPAAGPHSCTPCHAGSNGPAASTASAQCVCIAGYFSTSVVAQCQPCLAGTYKNSSGNRLCDTCTANSVTVSPNADARVATEPATAVTDCVCDASFTGPPGGPCDVCEANFFCRGFTAQGAIQACRQNSTSPSGSSDDSDCVCVMGFYSGPSGLCNTCPRNQYCPGDDTMYGCPEHSTAPPHSTAETDCTCDSGYMPE